MKVCRGRGRAEVYTVADKDGSFILVKATQRATDVLLSNANSKEKMSACSQWLWCDLRLQIKDRPVIYLHTVQLIDAAL